MGLFEIAAIALGGFAALHWLVIPQLRRMIAKPSPNRPLRLVLTLIVANLIRSTCLIAAIMFGTIAVILHGLTLAGHAVPLARLAEIFHALSRLRENVERVDKTWSLATIGLLSVALWIAARRDAKRQVSSAVDAAIAQLQADAVAGNLQPLEPTPRMQQLAGHLEKVEQAIVANAEQPQPDSLAAERLSAEAGVLREQIQRLDALRRLDVGSHLLVQSTPPLPANRFAAVLASAGVLQTLSFGSKVLATASLALFAPALVTLSGEQLAESIADTNADLHRLIVAESRAQAERDWLREQPPPAQPREVTEADQQLIQQLSYHYQVYARQLTAAEYHVPAHAFQLASDDVRHELLAQFATSHPTSLEVHGGVPEQRDEANLAMHAASVDRDGPEAARFRERMAVFARTTPQAEWERFTAKASAFVHTMAQPAAARDIGQALFTEVLNMGGDLALDPGSHASAYRELVSQLGKPGDLAEQAGELMDTDILRFATGVRESGSPAGAKPDLPFGVPRHTDQTDEWAERLQGHLDTLVARTNESLARMPPTLNERAPPEPQLRAALAAARDMMKQAPDTAAAARASDVVASYSDLFPGILGDEARTPRATLVREFPNVAEAMGQGIAHAADVMKASFVRARSYAALRGFTKIGGVLIGLVPNDHNGPSIMSLDWTDNPNGIILHLGRADGTVLHYGPFRAEVVRTALAYASDGRPIAATMPPALIGRQVMLHPALVDSTLGCEARLLDQFVDGATAGDPVRVAAEQLIDNQEALYRIGRAVQLQTIARVEPNAFGQDVQDVLTRLEALLTDRQLADSARQALAEPAAWSNAAVSPMTTKKAFFDQRLVGAIGQCMANRDLDGFKTCMAARQPSASYLESGDWREPPPRFRAESGVRELAYTVTDDLDFLDLQRSRPEPLWPFDFMLQITFESAPSFTDQGTAEFDNDPFEFPMIKQHLHVAVTQAIASEHFKQMDAARVLTDMREFAVLQRFIRLALSGDLGQSFPIGRFVELAKVQPHVAPTPVRTLRWNIFSTRQRDELVQAGFGSQLEALGYERDYQQFVRVGPHCPLIRP
jgi:hypothetical protein